MADHFEFVCGWRSYFVGANKPVRNTSLIAQKRPNVVAFSATRSHYRESLINAVIRIRGKFPSFPILVGGQALCDAKKNLKSVCRVCATGFAARIGGLDEGC